MSHSTDNRLFQGQPLQTMHTNT